ncbi:MAG TPA: Gfo/Idh/MocA family oxidoreductase [Thermoleophilaceae bacterium]
MSSTRRFRTDGDALGAAGSAVPGLTRVAVVGLGYWGPNLLRVLFELPDVEVKYVCDLDPDRLAKSASRYPSVEPTTNFERVLRDPDVDAVIIATPVFTHFDLASRSLNAGKHTFVEKPLAASSAEAEELIELADQRDRLLMCGHTFIYSPPVQAVKRMIDAGDLGDIYFISSSRVNLGLHQRDVSVIWDLGPHDFSILLYWLDELPEWVGAVGRASIVPRIPDVAFVDLSYASGTIAHVEMSWLAPSKLRRTVVVGSEKMVVYDDTSPEPIRVFDSGVGVTYEDPESFGQYQLSYRTGDILSPKLETHEPLANELGQFVDDLRSGRSSNGNAQLARDVVALIEAAEASLDERGAPIAVTSAMSVSAA